MTSTAPAADLQLVVAAGRSVDDAAAVVDLTDLLEQRSVGTRALTLEAPSPRVVAAARDFDRAVQAQCSR
jgi:hypothetical protein